ncbi:MAG: hypothetical protein HY720_20170 [Planctomycetes bacterium]|nr:hypothetical protein [Planctomycetota bacterium]
MRSFFRALERRGAEYLLISGQASVLYGGATFSEDFDLWVRPTKRNIEGTVRALRDVGARVYKLTPPLEPRHWRAGHAFHFRVTDAFVDLMPRPPRAGGFVAAARRSTSLETDWGHLPVVSIQDLVEIKKTRRPADYDVITNLAGIRLRRAQADGGPTRSVLRWALENTFRREDLLAALRRWPAGRALALRSPRSSLRLAAAAPPERAIPSHRAMAIQVAMMRELDALWRADARYWKPIIEELRLLRRANALLPDGAPV